MKIVIIIPLIKQSHPLCTSEEISLKCSTYINLFLPRKEGRKREKEKKKRTASVSIMMKHIVTYGKYVD